MNRISKLLLGGAGLAVTLSVAAIAQVAPPPPPGPPHMMKMPETRAEVQAMVAEHFKLADTNKDGFVTRDEMAAARTAMRAKFEQQFEAKRAERQAERFAQLDTNKDGSLSKAEFSARPPRPEGGPDRGPGHWGDRDGPGGHHGKGMRDRGGRGMRGHGGPGFGEGWFERADVNKDNKVSLAEAQAQPLAMFDKADTNHDGKLSDAEKQAARQAMRGMWKGRD